MQSPVAPPPRSAQSARSPTSPTATTPEANAPLVSPPPPRAAAPARTASPAPSLSPSISRPSTPAFDPLSQSTRGQTRKPPTTLNLGALLADLDTLERFPAVLNAKAHEVVHEQDAYAPAPTKRNLEQVRRERVEARGEGGARRDAEDLERAEVAGIVDEWLGEMDRVLARAKEVLTAEAASAGHGSKDLGDGTERRRLGIDEWVTSVEKGLGVADGQ
ncbi:hypothetical protein JCM10212_000021 [Sporobolomyces blumeae]